MQSPMSIHKRWSLVLVRNDVLLQPDNVISARRPLVYFSVQREDDVACARHVFRSAGKRFGWVHRDLCLVQEHEPILAQEQIAAWRKKQTVLPRKYIILALL